MAISYRNFPSGFIIQAIRCERFLTVSYSLPASMVFLSKVDQVFDLDRLNLIADKCGVLVTKHLVYQAGGADQFGFRLPVFERSNF